MAVKPVVKRSFEMPHIVRCCAAALAATVGLIAPARASGLTAGDACRAASDANVPGVVWQGTDRLDLPQIAGLLAPMLWFSPNEPLLAEGSPPIPTPHPCDRPSDHAVVYYQVTRLTYRGDSPVGRPEQDDPAFADKVASFILNYYFYYPEDFGVGAHLHDLETAEFEVKLESHGGCRRVRLVSIEALAHGSRWYSNILEVQPDLKYPVTLAVEEGKHAPAPDRNADGAYMRGYDVTKRINDAWGVRDTLGQGVLLSSAYAAEMTRQRTPAYRVMPPESPFLQVTSRQRSYRDGEPSLGRYELRPANLVAACAEIPPPRALLLGMMSQHRFGSDQLPSQHKAGSADRTLSELSRPDSWFSPSFRRAGQTIGAGFVFKGLDLREGWIVPRATFSNQDVTAEVMFTPSASRWADYYVSGGVRRQYVTTHETRTFDTEQGPQEISAIITPNWKAVVETGVKFRAKLPSKMRPFVLGYSFGGMRIGVQALGFSQIDQLRFIWEVGAGAW